jgi:hypothetical protein
MYMYIYMEHLFLMFLDHTRRRSTVGRTPLDEWSARQEESYRLCCIVVCDLVTSRICTPYIYDISTLRVNIVIINKTAQHTYWLIKSSVTAYRCRSWGQWSVSGFSRFMPRKLPSHAVHRVPRHGTLQLLYNSLFLLASNHRRSWHVPATASTDT